MNMRELIMARDLQRWGVWRFRPETQTLEYPHHDPFLDLNESNADSSLPQFFPNFGWF